jgi:hypothetical protein
MLPPRGGEVAAVAILDGPALTRPEPETIEFSGYEWAVREVASDRGGTRNDYALSNAWTDQDGFLHLRIVKDGDHWTSAEVSLTRSLGYGSYSFDIQDISHLEPAMVFSIFTWDDFGPPREMDIEISQWGEATAKNAQYVIQPYYVPANAVRFLAPPGTLEHSFKWEPGRVSFATSRVRGEDAGLVVDQHSFSSGVPSPGSESVHMNLYVFDNPRNPLRHGSEVVIEKFEYLP